MRRKRAAGDEATKHVESELSLSIFFFVLSESEFHRSSEEKR
jgi:hypothetical protein